MGSDLYVHLDRAARLLREIPERHDPLPQDIGRLLDHAYDDVQEARGKDRAHDRVPTILRHFDAGDQVVVIVQAFCGDNGAIHQQILPVSMSVPDVMLSVVLQPPRHRSPNSYEKIGNKIWYFTSDLPVTVASRIDATMHLETPSDRREVFHLEGEHWSAWHEKNGSYWSILTIFKDHTQVTEVRNAK
jgi:hypothetical protein